MSWTCPMNATEREIPYDLFVRNLLALEEVAKRLTKKYPPDWLERHGKRIYGVLLSLSFLAYLSLSFHNFTWWAFLIPVLVPPIIAYIPDIFFARIPGYPRWAHPLAIVDHNDMKIVHQIVHSTNEARKQRMMEYCPANTGNRVFAILEILRDDFRARYKVMATSR